jgi:hypothetical protein
MKKNTNTEVTLHKRANEMLELIGVLCPTATREQILSDAILIGLTSIMSSSKYAGLGVSAPKRAKPRSGYYGRVFSFET